MGTDDYSISCSTMSLGFQEAQDRGALLAGGHNAPFSPSWSHLQGLMFKVSPRYFRDSSEARSWQGSWQKADIHFICSLEVSEQHFSKLQAYGIYIL